MTDPSDRITVVEACRVAGGAADPVHPSTLWRWAKAGRISPPMKIGPGTARFSRSKLCQELGIEHDAA